MVLSIFYECNFSNLKEVAAKNKPKQKFPDTCTCIQYELSQTK